VVETNFAESGVCLYRDFDRQLPHVTVDVGKMRQVCMNLVMNAFQASERDGCITISTRSDTVRGGFKIAFTDTGCGIAADIRDAIFDPFFTTKEPGQGTGLGLAVSYGIIQEHNGTIAVESEVGQGTTFEIWLPLGAQADEAGHTDRR
jgi:two-component system NtrC family sensor kinase